MPVLSHERRKHSQSILKTAHILPAFLLFTSFAAAAPNNSSVGTGQIFGNNFTANQPSQKALLNGKNFALALGQSQNSARHDSMSLPPNPIGAWMTMINRNVTADPQILLPNLNDVIPAKNGTAPMAGGGQTLTVDFHGDKLLSFALSPAIIKAPRELPLSTISLLASSSGKSVAQGIQAAMTAQTANKILGHVINMSGAVEANSVSIVNGAIVLGGGQNPRSLPLALS